MRMCLSGSSFDDNLKHNIYFHPAEKRGYSFKPIEYIGLYKDKAIKAIGKVDKVIVTEINESSLSLKTVYPVGTELSIDEYEIVKNKIMVLEKEKWTNLLNEPHYYYLIEDFIETDYKKTSKGGSMGVKYFNVNEILNRDCLTTEQIAKELCNKDWE